MNLKFNQEGLIPVIVQDDTTLEVLMLAYMNEEAYQKTLKTKQATYYSRSREKLWRKGETSGHTQTVKSMAYDCDEDALLLRVDQIGPACHTMNDSCFYRMLLGEDKKPVLTELMTLLKSRKETLPEKSYTSYLFKEGLDKILKKIAEESGEVIIASKNQSQKDLVNEISDLVYHLMVLMVEKEVPIEKIEEELRRRRG